MLKKITMVSRKKEGTDKCFLSRAKKKKQQQQQQQQQKDRLKFDYKFGETLSLTSQIDLRAQFKGNNCCYKSLTFLQSVFKSG